MLLDTTFCIDLMREWRRGLSGPATAKLKSLGATPVEMSLFFLCELQVGARLSAKPVEELRRLERISGLIQVVYPDRSFAVMFGRVAAELRTTGIQIPLMDMTIGAHALCLGFPLLTRDAEHFQRIPNLVVETY